MKKIIILSFSIVLVFILSACANKNQNTPQSGNFPRRPNLDFGQPETQPSLSGIVKTIVGNEVTILKIDRPAGQMGGGANQLSAKTEGDNSQEKKSSVSLGGSPMGGPGMGGPGMGGNRRQATAEEKTSMIEMFKEISSGEETVTIPVGIRMLKSSDGASQERGMVAATLEDIKQDSMLTIWLDESITDRKIAKFVMIK